MTDVNAIRQMIQSKRGLSNEDNDIKEAEKVAQYYNNPPSETKDDPDILTDDKNVSPIEENNVGEESEDKVKNSNKTTEEPVIKAENIVEEEGTISLPDNSAQFLIRGNTEGYHVELSDGDKKQFSVELGLKGESTFSVGGGRVIVSEDNIVFELGNSKGHLELSRAGCPIEMDLGEYNIKTRLNPDDESTFSLGKGFVLIIENEVMKVKYGLE